MKLLLCLAALVAVSFAGESIHIAPKVQVYSSKPGEFGQVNTLICHVSDFHPPDISIQLMKGDQEIPNAAQTDLAFNQKWHFHLTRSVNFNPLAGESYSCKVKHGLTEKDFAWEPNM